MQNTFFKPNSKLILKCITESQDMLKSLDKGLNTEFLLVNKLTAKMTSFS